MNETLERRCELLVENQRAMCKSFMLEHSLTNAVVAAAFAEREMKLDVDQLRNARKLLKERKGIFSEFRAYMSGEKANASSIGGDIGRLVALQTAMLITMMMIMTTTAIALSSH